MIDKGHCFLNMEDEEEYVNFYDFSKAYKDHPLLIKDEEEKNESMTDEEKA